MGAAGRLRCCSRGTFPPADPARPYGRIDRGHGVELDDLIHREAEEPHPGQGCVAPRCQPAMRGTTPRRVGSGIPAGIPTTQLMASAPAGLGLA